MTSQADSSARDNSPVKSRPGLKFRVLILGRANAGKTTILERIAGAAVSEAEVWRGGERLPTSMIKGQSDRGLHNIEYELRFPSRRGFVFHDSRGIESGSAEELETLRKFVETRSSTNSIHEQLHAIWMCVPLDESRELFQGERAPFGWSKGVAPLVVIFTKRDGAVLKETSKIMEQMSKDSSVTTISRSEKSRVRREADNLVTHRINELEGELRDLSPQKDTLGFLTAGGMQKCTDETEKTCQELIKLTEGQLNGPTMKTLLSVVWGQNLSRQGFWAFYWMLLRNHSGGKLGSGEPNTDEMLKRIVEILVYDARDGGLDDYVVYFFGARDGDDYFGDHYDARDGDHYDVDNDYIGRLSSLFSSIFHLEPSGFNDVQSLTLTVLVLVVIRAVHADILLLSRRSFEPWLSAMATCVAQNAGVVQEKVDTISSQVAVIIAGIKHKDIFPRLNRGAWKFSDKEAKSFATQLAKCVDENLM